MPTKKQRIKYRKLEAKFIDDNSLLNDTNWRSFEQTRWHSINYILMEGGNVLRSHHNQRGKKRNRPGWIKEEFGTIIGKNCFYSFHVDPSNFFRAGDRSLKIIVGSYDGNRLNDLVS